MSFIALLTADPVTPFLAAALVALLAVAGCVLLWMRSRTAEQAAARLGQALDDLRRDHAGQMDAAQARIREMSERMGRAETRAEQADLAAQRAEGERNAARQLEEAANERRNQAERQAALAEQQVAEIEKRFADWERAKAESLNHAKAAVLETAQTVSRSLIQSHKIETEAAKAETEKRVRETTAALVERYEGVSRVVSGLTEQVSENRRTVDTVWRALTSPGGAGHFSEIGLENTLKGFGLLAGRDFLIQATVEGHEDGARLRPDALVFLPNDSALVIDSKASKFLVEIAAAESEEAAREAAASLARTMNAHLKALASKDYRSAVRRAWRNAGRGEALRRVQTVMYLPNDGALEKVQAADPDFARKAAEAEIIPVGPAGLTCIVGFARVDIDLGRQAANHEFIVERTQDLLETMIVLLDHADSVGTSIKRAADSYEKLSKTVNGRLIPRAKKLADLGVRPANNKALPSGLAAYSIARIDSVIEGEAEHLDQASGSGRALGNGRQAALPGMGEGRTSDSSMD